MNTSHTLRHVVTVEEHGFELRLKLDCGHVFYMPGGRRQDVPAIRRCYACEAGLPPLGKGERDA